MSTSHSTVRVRGQNGAIGTAPADSLGGGDQVVVTMETGQQALVPASELTQQPDGSLLLSPALEAQLERRLSRPPPPPQPEGDGMRGPTGQVVAGSIPVVQEQAEIKVRKKETSQVVVHITPGERQEVVDVPLEQQEVDVRRIEVNRFVDAPPEVRQDGDVTIVPVMEEVLVVEKRLRVREEIHLIRRRSTLQRPQQVTLRTEEAHILRWEDKQKQ